MFNYRPQDEDDDWEDNAVSNALAYLSDKLLPSWCKTSNHWTMRLALFFWASCPCCLFYRGACFGGGVVALCAIVAALLFW